MRRQKRRVAHPTMAPGNSDANEGDTSSGFARSNLIRAGLLFLSILPITACANAPTDAAVRAELEHRNDPLEPTNRAIFAGNQFVDQHAMQPVARRYRTYVPGVVKAKVTNLVRNLQQPSVALNDLFQGNIRRGWNTVERFSINSSAGALGLFDVATDWGFPEHSADFGQTLGVWGVEPGPSIQLPVFGPSNVRDSAGTVVDFLINPTNIVPVGAVTTALSAVNAAGAVSARASMLDATDMLEKSSLDYYASLRNVVAQRRKASIAEGRAGLIEEGGSTAILSSLSSEDPFGASSE